MPKPQNKEPLHGWLILDKPKGLTSTQALGRARKLLGGKKAGHGGTLDPLATGILPLAFGEATKLIPYVIDGEKEYEFTIQWGEGRDTDDAEGKVTEQSKIRPTVEAIRAALPAFKGNIEQTPPAYSAIKLDGERAYDIARAGGTPDIKPRPVQIRSFDLLTGTDPDHATFRVTSGKGMYVRALARDLAATLGTFGHITALRRTRVGPFNLAGSTKLPHLETLAAAGQAQTVLKAIETAMPLPSLLVSAAEAQRFRTGQGLLIRPAHGAQEEGVNLLAAHDGVPIAIVEVRNGEFRVMRGFHF